MRVGRGTVVTTDNPRELRPLRRSAGVDVGWAVSELFEAAWIASGRPPEELRRSPRERRGADRG
jgi:hypothetical protein